MSDGLTPPCGGVHRRDRDVKERIALSRTILPADSNRTGRGW